MLSVERLVKRYGALRAVDGIDFEISAGEVFAFLGPNGAGKTTTVEILEGLRRPTAGRVRVLGSDPWSEGARLQRRIGVLAQDFHFFPKLSPAEALELYARLFDVPPRTEELLRRVELHDKRHAYFDTLSGGQKQKLGLALALVDDPEICFLDEPTTGLDPRARRSIWELIRGLRREGRTVFLTTHYLEEAQILSDRIAIIDRGRIIAAGAPEEIIRRHGRGERLILEEAPGLGEYLRAHLDRAVFAEDDRVEVPLRDPDDALQVLELVRQSRLPYGHFATAQDTLEDVFLRLGGRPAEEDAPEAATAR